MERQRQDQMDHQLSRPVSHTAFPPFAANGTAVAAANNTTIVPGQKRKLL